MPPAQPITHLTQATPVPPVTPEAVKGKGKGKTSTLKTPSIVMPNPNDYGPLVPGAIEKALLETNVPNIVMYNNRIQGCYYEKCRHKQDPMFMIPPNNIIFRTQENLMAFKSRTHTRAMHIIVWKCWNVYTE